MSRQRVSAHCCAVTIEPKVQGTTDTALLGSLGSLSVFSTAGERCLSAEAFKLKGKLVPLFFSTQNTSLNEFKLTFELNTTTSTKMLYYDGYEFVFYIGSVESMLAKVGV